MDIEKQNKIKTEFGNARIDDNGYYKICSKKEGNKNKYLHRLIFEKYYGPIPKGFDIHHIDGDKLNNCLFNLQLMRHNDHAYYHNKGKKHSAATCAKMSKSRSGEKHPLSKYHNLWDNAKVVYDKSKQTKDNGGVRKCFGLKYGYKRINCGMFLDPISCEIIHDIIDEECG